MRWLAGLGACLALVAATAAGQDASSRPWQHRLQTEVPVPVPMVELEAANPFSAAVEEAPRLISAVPPRRIDVAGVASAAAYVDANGECLGAVPLALPFPGLTSVLVDELRASRFDPARSGSAQQPSWTVLEVTIEGRIKEAEVVEQSLALPDPETPPSPSPPARVAPSGNLVNLPATPADQLSARASARRLRVKVPARDADVVAQALAHITAGGRCDRFVVLDLPSGLERWLSAYLATWRLDPARRAGEAVDSWAVYNARLRIGLSGLESTTFRTSAAGYDPAQID